MPKENQMTINEMAGEVLDVPCLLCKHLTKHEILASVDFTGRDEGYGGVEYWTHHQVIRCRGCESISYRTVDGNAMTYEYVEPDGIEYLEQIELFPNRNTGRLPMKDAYLLPPNVQRIYEETIKATNNDQPVLTGIAVRALVETVCKDKQAAGHNLVQQIDSLVQLGALTADGAIILHKIRTLGNAAAHEVKPHTTEQLGLALDVCEHLLKGVYVLPKHASETFT
jgi:hypothetical protein